VSLRHHLRADEHGARLARETVEHLLERTASRRRVRIEAQHGAPRAAGVDDGLDHALGAGTQPHDVDGTAGRAGPRHLLEVAAMVAAEAAVAVQGEADVAVRAAEPATTGAAVQSRSRAAAVEQQDRASPLVGERAEAIAQRA